MIVEILKDSILNTLLLGDLISKNLKDLSKNLNYCDDVIPRGWKLAKVGDVIEIVRGASPRPIKSYITNSDNGINWIKIGDTEKGSKYIDSCREKIIPEGKSKSRYVEKGDFLLSNSMSFGRPYILNIDGCVHDGWLILKDKEKTFSKDYLFYLLSSKLVYKQFCDKASGAVVTNLNTDKVRETIIPIPPLEEQIDMANKIEELFKMLDEVKPIEDKLNKIKSEFPTAMKISLLEYAMRGKLVKNNEDTINNKKSYQYDGVYDIPDNWYWAKIEDVLDIQTGLSFKKSEQCKESADALRILRGGNINNNFEYLLKEDDIYVTYTDKYTELLAGDVITPSVTSMEQMGKTAYIDMNLKNITAGGFVYIIRSKNFEVLNPKFMMYFINSNFHKQMCKPNIHRSGEAFYNLKKSGLIKQPIPIPPIEEQKRIVEKIEEVLPIIESINNMY